MPDSNISGRSSSTHRQDEEEPKSAPVLPDEGAEEVQDDATSDAIVDETEKDTDTEEAAPKDDGTEELGVENGGHEQLDVDTPKQPGKIKRFFMGYWRKKRWTLPLTFLVILGVIFAVPTTRYPILAMSLKRSYGFILVDSKTNTPVSGAKVTLDGKTATTDSSGKASLQAKVGKRSVRITKQYYKDFTQTVFVGVSASHNSDSVKLDATGRQVPIKVVNKITGKPVADVDVKVLDTTAKTDASGMATIVLPTSSTTQDVIVTAGNYNALSAKVQVTSRVVAANTFAITPAGKVYFLSNLSGNIDVVSTNLDGTARKTVLAGTGSEDSNNTVLLASRDWKYLALLSKRDGGSHAKLFLINTASDQMMTMDEGAADFTPIGWSDHNFVYQVDRTSVKNWQSNSQALKSYNADNSKLATLDQTTAEGTSDDDYASQSLNPYSARIVGDGVVYTKTWSVAYMSPSRLNGKSDQILSIDANGSNRQALKTFARSPANNYQYISVKVYKPHDVYFAVYNNGSDVFYEYKNGNVTQSNTINESAFNQTYPTYLTSPSDGQTFWAETRDGKNTLFVGDTNGNNGNQIASLSDYNAYGWFTDGYLLVSKNSSELYIMPAAGGNALKVSDYFKVQRSYAGYGYGYGGL